MIFSNLCKVVQFTVKVETTIMEDAEVAVVLLGGSLNFRATTDHFKRRSPRPHDARRKPRADPEQMRVLTAALNAHLRDLPPINPPEKPSKASHRGRDRTRPIRPRYRYEVRP